MCNCGNKRTLLKQQFQKNGKTGSEIPLPEREKVKNTRVSFKYAGQEVFAVQGHISGKVYRFHPPFETIEVDVRDAPALTAIPSLQVVKYS